MSVVLSGAVMIALTAHSQTGSHVDLGDEQFYRQSLYLHLQNRVERPDGVPLMTRSREKLRRSLKYIPDERRTAHVFFPDGLTPGEAVKFLGRASVHPYTLTVALKTPQGMRMQGVDEGTLGKQTGTLVARFDAAVREMLRYANTREPRIPADAAYVVIEVGLIASGRDISKLTNTAGDFTFSFRPSARVASAVDARLLCHQQQRDDCVPSIIDMPMGQKPRETSEATRQSLASYLKTTDADEIARKLADSARDIKIRALEAPRERRAAQVFFKHGLDGWAVQSALEPVKLELVAAEARVSSLTVVFDGNKLAEGESIEERIDLAWGHERATNPALAGSRGNVMYRVEVVGSWEWLKTLLINQDVQGVIVEESKPVAQRADADDPRPEQRMKRLPIPGAPFVPEIRPRLSASMQQAVDFLRRQAEETPRERRTAALLLASPLEPQEVELMLTSARLRFVNHRPAMVVARAGRPWTLSPEILSRQHGGLSQQLRRAAEEGRDIDEGEDMRVLQLGVEGELGDLVGLLRRQSVLAVVLTALEI